MVFSSEIDSSTRAKILLFYEKRNITVKEICKKFDVSRASVYRIVKEKRKTPASKKKRNGRKRKLNDHYRRSMVRTVKRLRLDNGNFTRADIRKGIGLAPEEISLSTISREMHKLGFGLREARKKGVLTLQDTRKRLKWAKAMRRNMGERFWTEDVSFYLDGVSFVFKTNPMDQAKTPRGKIWRRKNEALDIGCTAKGSHVGSGGKLLKLIVAISYDKGVVLCEPYTHMDGEFYAGFVKEHFPELFRTCEKNRECFVQDGDPSQNSAAAKKAFARLRATKIDIPPRSPDLNPIENLFALVRTKLHQQALEQHIIRENVEEFSNRVITLFSRIDIQTINNIIGSMPTRIQEVIKCNGNRTRY